MKHGWTLIALFLGGTLAMTQAQAPAKTEGGADAIRPFLVSDLRAAFKSLR